MQKSKNTQLIAVKTNIITVNNDLRTVMVKALKPIGIREGDIIVITSKVVAVTQGRTQKIQNQKEFDAIVQQEADKVLGGSEVTLTLKDGIFTPWAGIDRSNIEKGNIVLWPKNPYEVAQELCLWLKKEFKRKKLGVIIVDSFCVPLRKGVTGIAIGYAGFNGVIDQRGKKDLYGNVLKVTQENIADSLATMGNLIMGQGREQTPFAVVRHAPVKFIQKKVERKEMVMSPKECLYQPLYKGTEL